MRFGTTWTLFIIFLATLFLLNCGKSQTENSNVQVSTQTVLLIEKVDFRNFTFEYPPDKSKGGFTITNGEKPYGKTEDISFKLTEVSYADLTNDGNNEAIISIEVGLAVSGTNLVYIYSIENNEPKILWSFWTGENAFGGLKKAYSESGNLVIETFGKYNFENGEWNFRRSEINYQELKRPTAYTKIVFKWNGEKFVPFGKRQVFDYNWKKNRKNSY